jgi:cytochrome b6-f complex iron-sulfur subunit
VAEAPAASAAVATPDEDMEADQPSLEAAPAAETEAPAAEPKALPAAEAEVAQPSGASAPQRPAGGKRSPEEILAQREAWLARKSAQDSGQAPVPAPEPAPAAAELAAVPTAAKAAPEPAAVAKAAPKAKPAPPAPRKKEAAAPVPIDPNITRRELLNYAWLASIGLVTLQTVGLSLWFAFPNFLEGQFGGEFSIGLASNVVPEVNSAPVPKTDGKFWLSNVDMESSTGEPNVGVLALFKVCTHLGCLYEWIDVTFRFECPCHGSKFALNGEYLAGPARRSLDRFVILAFAPDGTLRDQTNAEGDPLIVRPDDILVVDTGQRILGSSEIIIA